MFKKIMAFVLNFALVALLIDHVILVNLDTPVRLTLAYGLALIISGFSMTRIK